MLRSLTDEGVSGRGVWGAALSLSQSSELFVGLLGPFGSVQLVSATALSHSSSIQGTPSPQPAERGEALSRGTSQLTEPTHQVG